MNVEKGVIKYVMIKVYKTTRKLIKYVQSVPSLNSPLFV